MGRLEGKVAVITGGSSGIGLRAVERFVAEGARVVFSDLPAGGGDQRLSRGREVGGPHDGHAIAERLGPEARFVPADVTRAGELQAVFDAAVDAFGGLDVLFNNAGVAGAEGSVAEGDDDVFDRIVDVDLKGVWRGIRMAVPLLTARGGGSIISTASVAALRGVPGMAAYAAAKGGVVALTKVVAMELAPLGVRANCICPGAIVTPIICDSPVLPEPLDPAIARMALAGAQPLPRAGEADDVASMALFLASDESSFVTGQALVVDGGLSEEADARNRSQAVTDTLGIS